MLIVGKQCPDCNFLKWRRNPSRLYKSHLGNFMGLADDLVITKYSILLIRSELNLVIPCNANASTDNANASTDNANASTDNANASPCIKNATILRKAVLRNCASFPASRLGMYSERFYLTSSHWRRSLPAWVKSLEARNQSRQGLYFNLVPFRYGAIDEFPLPEKRFWLLSA
jgi:hypothetical protein